MAGPKHLGARKGESKGSSFKIPEERESTLKGIPTGWGDDEGYRTRLSPDSKWNVLELDCWADPRKTTEWALEMQATIGSQRFQREYLRNWALSTQSPFFPEWQNRGGRDTFCYDITELGRGDIVLGLDFGFRRPAIVAGQTNARKTRLYLAREWMPKNISGPAFMEVCEWLLGELPLEEVGPEGQRHVLDLRRLAEKGKGPPVPWFRHPGRVRRYSGPEALRTSQEVAEESEERRIADIWANRGFPLSLQAQAVKAGELILRHLLRTQPKKAIPYLIVDALGCPIFCEAMDGGFTYKRPTRENPRPDQASKDGYYEHIIDAVRYLATAAVDPLRIDSGEYDDNMGLKKAPRKKPSGREPGVYSRADVGKNDAEPTFSSVWEPPGRPARGVYSREEK